MTQLVFSGTNFVTAMELEPSSNRYLLKVSRLAAAAAADDIVTIQADLAWCYSNDCRS